MEKFIARQPIFTPDRAVYGYELLFRSSAENYFCSIDPDRASAITADNLFLFGFDRITQGRHAFFNCPREFLLAGHVLALPKDVIVVELLETIHVDPPVIAACQDLKRAGYTLALDDFVYAAELEPLILMADIIKVDVLATPPEHQFHLARQFSRTNVRLLAEKVETYGDFQRTLQWGYTYFQGYFFSRPQMMRHHDIPPYQLNYLRVLQAANRPEIDLPAIENGLKADASLSYRLLRYLNSPVFSLAVEVSSIPHALTLLGERGIRKWVSLVAVGCLGEDKPQELISLPLFRARFCELLAHAAGMTKDANDLFLLGLLSAMDAILDMEIEAVLAEITLRPEIRLALLGGENRFGEILRFVKMYERGAWADVENAGTSLGIRRDVLPDLYLQAVDWARAVVSGKPVPEEQHA